MLPLHHRGLVWNVHVLGDLTENGRHISAAHFQLKVFIDFSMSISSTKSVRPFSRLEPE